MADALGIPRFRLNLERLSGGRETDVTAQVRPYLHDRAAEILALQVFHPLGTQALQLDSRAFAERAEKLRRLEIMQVDDLVLRVAVIDTDLVREIGAGRDQDMYLDDRAAPPRLFHDLQGVQWVDRFRAFAGPYVAALVDNPVYGATFQLLLQQETPAQLEAFLEERSISEEDLELVRARMPKVDVATRKLHVCANRLSGEARCASAPR